MENMLLLFISVLKNKISSCELRRAKFGYESYRMTNVDKCLSTLVTMNGFKIGVNRITVAYFYLKHRLLNNTSIKKYKL